MDTPPRPQLTEEELEKVGLLFDWARQGDERLAQMLASGMPANIVNGAGDSMLMLAAYHGHHDTARALLEAGADPGAVNDRGQSPLAAACFRGDVTMARLLLAHGADAAQRLPGEKTALMFAQVFGRWELVELLSQVTGTQPLSPR